MYYQIKGIVLNSQIQGEANKSITVYTYEWGKINATVPSAKKITAKLSAATEPLTESDFMIYQNHPLTKPKITGAIILNNNSQLKTDLYKNLYGLYACEIVDKFVPYNVEHIEKYKLITRIFEVLAQTQNYKRAISAFMLRFLKLSGYSYMDYLKNSYTFLDATTINSIKKLSNCSGNDLDTFSDIDDDKVLDCIERYVKEYIKELKVAKLASEIFAVYEFKSL